EKTKDKEKELEKLIAELELTKQRTEEARKLAELSQSRAEAAKEASSPDGQGEKEQPLEKALPVKLKGVDLPFLAGEDKTDYESWKAARNRQSNDSTARQWTRQGVARAELEPYI
ncbi:unnamed protein product, partial [Porites lobata]